MSALYPELQEYSCGNTRHRIYKHPDESKRNAWTLIVGEDQPHVYHELLWHFVQLNLVGCALTVDLSDEAGIVNLLTTGEAHLGDSDASADLEGIDPCLTFVILDVKDDTLGRADEFRGIGLANRLRTLAEGRLVHVTVHPEEHLDAETTVAGKHKLGTVFSASKGADGSLTKETCARLEMLLINAKAAYGGNAFIIRGGSFKLIYETPDGQTRTTGYWPASPCVLAMHWLLAKRDILIEHMAMFCGLQDGGEKRRNQVALFEEYENWENRTQNKSLDARPDSSRPASKRRTKTVFNRAQIESERDTAASEMATASDDLAITLAFNLITVADETAIRRADLTRQINALRTKITSQLDLREWLADKNRNIRTKADTLRELTETSQLLHRHFLKLESHCYLQMFDKFLEQFLIFAAAENLIAGGLDEVYGEPDIVSEDGFQWINARLKKAFAERQSVYINHHHTWTVCNQALQVIEFPEQHLLSDNPTLENPLKSSGNVDKLRKDFVKLLRKAGHTALALHFEKAVFMHCEKMFYGRAKQPGKAWQLSPSSGPVVHRAAEGFKEQPFYKRWKQYQESQALSPVP